jgi:hypothetical protein
MYLYYRNQFAVVELTKGQTTLLLVLSSQEWYKILFNHKMLRRSRWLFGLKSNIEIKYPYQWPGMDHSPVMKSAWSDTR